MQKKKSHELDLTPKSGRQDFWTPLQRLLRPPEICLTWGSPSAAPSAPDPAAPNEHQDVGVAIMDIDDATAGILDNLIVTLCSF